MPHGADHPGDKHKSVEPRPCKTLNIQFWTRASDIVGHVTVESEDVYRLHRGEEQAERSTQPLGVRNLSGELGPVRPDHVGSNKEDVLVDEEKEKDGYTPVGASAVAEQQRHQKTKL